MVIISLRLGIVINIQDISLAVFPLSNSLVLVLNRLWQPVNICSARRAIGLIYLGHARAVHRDADQNFFTHDLNSWVEFSTAEDCSGAEIVHTISTCFLLPTVIVLATFDKLPKKEVKFSRRNVFERDRFTCQYCGIRFDHQSLNIDHVVPRDKGGKNTWENVVCSCFPCNTRKGNRLPADIQMFPINEPKAPRWRPFFSIAQTSQQMHDSWIHFLNPGMAGAFTSS
jgi:5-methylcytosine-specific restriction endonuclease McrA